MKFSDTMIVTDLDSTFGTASQGIPQCNIDAVNYFKKNGGLFTVASGRVPTVLDHWQSIDELVNVPAILCNGGFLFDFSTGKRLDQIELNHEKAIEIIKYVQNNHTVERIRCSLSGKEVKVTDDTDYKSFIGWTRVSFDGEAQELDLIRKFCEPNFCDYFSFMKSWEKVYEFQARDATKGLALERLRENLLRSGKVTTRLKVYAVGDFENDLDLLAHSDVSACPDNAIDKVKEVASVHLCHCHDGAIADLISRIEKGEA